MVGLDLSVKQPGSSRDHYDDRVDDHNRQGGTCEIFQQNKLENDECIVVQGGGGMTSYVGIFS